MPPLYTCSEFLKVKFMQLFKHRTLHTSRSQFSFKNEICTESWKLSLHITCMQQGSKVRCAFLDMSKAFDMVDYIWSLVWHVAKLPYPVLYFLIHRDSHQSFQILGCNHLSGDKRIKPYNSILEYTVAQLIREIWSNYCRSHGFDNWAWECIVN